MAQLAQRLGLNLADALAGDGKRLPDFFEGVLAAIVQSEAHLDDFLFARRQGFQYGRGLFLQIQVDDRIGGRNHGLVFNEVPEMRIFLFANGRFERDGLLRDFQNLSHLGHWDVHALGDFFARGLAAKFLDELAAGAHKLVDGLDHVHRDADGAGLFGNRAGDRLADPPRGVSGELIAATPLEFVHGLHQADVAFLNQVEELQAAVGVLLGDGYDQAEVGFDQFLFGLLGFRFAAVNQRERTLQFGEADFAGFLNILQFGAACTQLFAGFRGDFTLGNIRATLETARLALKRLQALDGAAHFVDQALLLKGIEVDVANSEGNFDTRARHRPLRANVGALLGFRGLLEFHRLLQSRFVELGNLVNRFQRLLGFVGDFFFGELLVVELNDFLDGAHTLAQVVADGNQFLDDNRRARDGAHDHELAALNALRDRDLAFARQERNCAHLAQIHAHGIVGFLERAGGKVQIGFAFVPVFLAFAVSAVDRHFHRTRGLGRRLVFVNLDTIALERREEIVDFFRGMHFRG